MFVLFSFFTGSWLGRICGYALLVITLLAGLKIGLWMHDRTVEQKAMLQFNQQQIELVQKNEEDFKQKMADLSVKQSAMQADLHAKDNKLDEIANSLEQKLDTDKTLKGKDTHLSSFLTETVKQMGKFQETN